MNNNDLLEKLRKKLKTWIPAFTRMKSRIDMQKIQWFILCLFFLNNHLAFADKQPLLVVTIMVKNEAPVMEATLKPFLEAGLQHYLVLDTGSTDGTIQVVRKLFQKYKISDGHIAEQPFVNFAVSRNHALECAEKIFPQATFFLMIDAEWYVHNVDGLLEFCAKNQNHKSKAFLIKRSFPLCCASDYGNYLFKAHHGIRYVGAVHEYINQTTDMKVPEDVFIVCNPSRAGNQKSFRRWHKDLDILLKEYEKNSTNLRTIFLIGQTYACLKNHEQAIFWYKKRCNEQKKSEENYQAHYRIALLSQEINKMPQALFYYFKAHYIRPQRIESLVQIAQYYLNIHDYYSAFLLAKYAASISKSSQEKLLIVPKIYDFTRYFILAQAAWQVGEYEIGRQATLKALEYDPLNIGLQKKLRWYEEVLNHKDCNLLDRNYWCQWCNGYFWLDRPEWFNFCCLSKGCYQSNRCNFSQGVTWRYWVGPFFCN